MPLVVINRLETMQEVLVKCGENFLDHPPVPIQRQRAGGGAAASKDGTEGSVTRTEANGDGDVVK